MSATGPHSTLNLQEQITRIDHLIAQTQKAQLDLDKGRVEIVKRGSKRAWRRGRSLRRALARVRPCSRPALPSVKLLGT